MENNDGGSGDEEEEEDETKSISPEDNEELQRLSTLVKNLPGEVALIPGSVQRIQQNAFTTIEKYSSSVPAKPKLYKANYTTEELKSVAQSTGRTESQVKDESQKYRDWFDALQKDHVDLEDRIRREIESVGITEAEKLRWHGTIPLMEMGDMWGRVKGKTMLLEDFKQTMDHLWLKCQFPKGWTDIPPKNEGDLPKDKELQQAVNRRKSAQRDLDTLKAKLGMPVTGNSSDGSAAAASGASNGAVIKSDIGPIATTGQSIPPASNAPSRALANPGTSADELSDKLSALLLHLTSGTGAFPGNQGQEGFGSAKRGKYQLQLPSIKSRQIEITTPNTTMNGDQIVAWFVRERKMKDDDDEEKTAKQTNRFFVVRKQKADGETIHEIMSAELCGARRAWDALQRDKVPELWDGKRLSELPSKRRIDKVEWGINWLAARNKINIRDGARDVPSLIVCMWWYVEAADTGKQKDFTKGTEPEDPRLRLVVLTRSNFHSLMGKERGEVQICQSLPHPEGARWESVEECIRYYTSEKVQARPGQLVRRS